MRWRFLGALRAIWIPVLLVHGLSGCGLAMRWGDTSADIQPDSDKAMVIGGVQGTKRQLFTVTFHRYDPNTQRLIPGGGDFFLWQTAFHSEPVARVVAPGYYIMTMMYDGAASVGGTIRTTVGLDQFSSRFVYGPDSDADVSNVTTYRFKIKAGEVIYLGEHVLGPYAPEWVDRQDELDKILREMPQIKIRPPFRPPLIARRLDK